jgi:hypothetical protein
MSMFHGMASLSRHRSGGVDVTMELLSGYLIIRTPDGEWLGSWPAISVGVSQVQDSRMVLTLGKELIHFKSQENEDLIEALEMQAEVFQSQSNWEKIARRAKMSLRRFDTFVEMSRQQPIGPEADAPLNPPIPEVEPVPHVPDDREVAYPERENAILADFSSGQGEVVEWIASAMEAWFDYFFLLGEGTIRTRLDHAADRLDQSAKGLRVVGEFLDGLANDDVTPDGLIQTYGIAVVGWADAFESMALGARLDQRHMARDGFAGMDKASETAERAVALRWSFGQQKSISAHLKTLGDMQPPRRVARRTVEKAKEPWRRALKAAGSPLRWESLST